MPYTQVNNLDFADIKTALKDYMRAQSDFTDYDFEGSVLSNMLDVLAYNTYYTAFNTNMVVNELFLDSASLRDNVVSLAKQLGYSPKSVTAPKAAIDLDISFGGTAPAAVTIKAGSGFVTNFDGSLYRFILKEDNKVSVANGVASFTDIEVYEGSFIKTTTEVSSDSSQKFKISNSGVDTNTINIKYLNLLHQQFLLNINQQIIYWILVQMIVYTSLTNQKMKIMRYFLVMEY